MGINNQFEEAENERMTRKKLEKQDKNEKRKKRDIFYC